MLKFLAKNNLNLFVSFAYILICFSISAKSFDMLFLTKTELNITFFINFLRSIISSFLVILFIGFIFWNSFKKKFRLI